MKGDAIPGANHIARYCGGSHFDPESGSLSPTAFMVQLKDTDFAVSVNWLEHLPFPDQASQIAEVKRVLAGKMSRIGAKSKLALLNVDTAIRKVFTATDVTISVLHAPEVRDPSHSGIHGLPVGEWGAEAVALSQAVMRFYPANLGSGRSEV